ncbi:dTDP-4-dehydrorhamnose reductase family protein [Paenibacillus sacheonensis]|uniref:dTDP-4-dehydrorhamnose reductase n=1 Tax=Paenibacillus sacheonensis TaxID=742054 RepID=A0A7X5C2W8_9BACL|nr:SDR family oxidoreductase [Paenibacillus sacheonensis]MBM7569275.1 dTDP-4-dehydrorhamnose reductase [Paenibacillus sacheonensis]NBC71715.1 sugar nucleotide-binding protein [Paenibacillus sacheonensis]
MKLLVIGGNGMAGHALIRYFREEYPEHEVVYTTRRADGEGSLALDAADAESVAALVQSVRPEIIINAAGVLNQDAESHPLAAYMVNGFLPHWLRYAADTVGARVIHISSDCVFSGERGSYTEQDHPDGTSVYARSKALGEMNYGRHLTIRTSIIGPEIRPNGIGLLKWFLAQSGLVKGYANVLWNGVTTLELAKATAFAIEHPHIGGLVHLTASESVNKLTLLLLFQAAFEVENVRIVSDDRVSIDRTLVSTRRDWTYRTSGYIRMLDELAMWMKRA